MRKIVTNEHGTYFICGGLCDNCFIRFKCYTEDCKDIIFLYSGLIDQMTKCDRFNKIMPIGCDDDYRRTRDDYINLYD
jgi:hypothetical protein